MSATRCGHQGQGGQAIVIVALIALVAFGLVGITVDQGIGMADRRDLQADADGAALAGAREYSVGNDSNAAHRTALRYVAKSLNSVITFPLAGTSGGGAVSCTASGSCPAGVYPVGSNYTSTLADSGTQTLDVALSHSRRTVIAGVLGFNTAVSGTSGRATPTGPTLHSAAYALVAVTGTAMVHGGGTPSPTGTVSGAVYVHNDFGANNGPHAPPIPAEVTGYDGTVCTPNQRNHVDLGGASNGLQYNWQATTSPPQSTGVQNTSATFTDPFTGDSPTPNGTTFTTTAAATDASGNWKPGTYNGVFPSGGKLNPGVYKIINVTRTINLGSATNLIYTASGTEDTAGAVSIVVDGSDTGRGGMDLSSAVLNGLDDLHPATYTGTRDPQGTHNFVIYGGGSSPFTGSITIGPGASTDLSGIIYLPNSSLTMNGNSSPKFTGAVYVADMTINGGGNGTQQFNYVCNLSSVAGAGSRGGLTR